MRKGFLLLLCFLVLAGSSSAQNTDNYSPEGHYREAERLLSLDQCAEALKHINKTLAAKPSEEAYVLRSMIHECNDDLNAAITDYSILVHRQPENSEFLFSRAVLRYRAEQYEPAIEDLQQSMAQPMMETNMVFYKTQPGDQGISGLSTLKTMQGEVYNYMGLSFFQLHQYDSAISNFNKSLEIRKTAQILNNRALAYEKKDQFQKAASDYEEALVIEPQNPVAIYNLINLYGQLNEPEKQKAAIEKLGPGQELAETYVFKGVAAYKMDEYELAVAEYDSALMLSNEDEEVYLYRGQAYEKLREFDRAISDYEMAIRLSPKYASAFFNLGNVYYRLNRLDESIAHYDLAVLYAPRYTNAYMNRGIVYLRKKDFEKACSDLEVAKSAGVPEATDLYNRKCLDQ